MGDLTCDDCGSEIYVVPTDNHQFDAELACNCPDRETVGFVFRDGKAHDGEPSSWGLDRTGDNYVEFSSGRTPTVRTHVGGGRTVRTGYHLAIGDGFGPHFEFRQVPHNAWRADSDPDKWPDSLRDAILDVLDEYGELKRGEIAEELGIPREAAVCLVRELQNANEVEHTGKAYYMTKDEFMENFIL